MNPDLFKFINSVHAERLTEVSVYAPTGELIERSLGFVSHPCTYWESVALLGIVPGLKIVFRELL